MKRIFTWLFKKEVKRRYPMPDKRNIIFKNADGIHYVTILLLFLLVAASCTPMAKLPNGCKYKVYAPKFTK